MNFESLKSILLCIFRRGMLELHNANGVENLGHIKWQMALCLLAVYLICYFSLWKGISTSGKVSGDMHRLQLVASNNFI